MNAVLERIGRVYARAKSYRAGEKQGTGVARDPQRGLGEASGFMGDREAIAYARHRSLEERVMLADWSSLHLDVLARDRELWDFEITHRGEDGREGGGDSGESPRGEPGDPAPDARHRAEANPRRAGRSR